MSYFNKIAIANRGEVALRIIKTCKKLNIPTVLLHSTVDAKNTKAYYEADECICIGQHNAYLDIDKVITGLTKSKAQALHPGFGFLSENAKFARCVEEQGVNFIGPSSDAILKMGDKTTARRICEKMNIPIIPGYNGEKQDNDTLIKEAELLGFPVLIKASLGGGGRGIRVCKNKSDFLSNVESAKRESKASFNSDQIFIEKYMDKAKHVEFQILADGKDAIHLYERECSVQRKHQKIIEESLCPALDDNLRQKMASSAIKAAKAVQYVGAGTVEFLLFKDRYYFLEMNTRLQVEHPVTEMILDVDIVELQIRIAKFKKLPIKQKDLKPKGHAIECRIYAEKDGIPSTGEILYYSNKSNIRCDDGFSAGHSISEFYDSMFAKIIAHADTKEDCIQQLNKAFKKYLVFGIETNLKTLSNIINHKTFLESKAHINLTDYFQVKEDEYYKEYIEFWIKKEINHLQLLNTHESSFKIKKHNKRCNLVQTSTLIISGKNVEISYIVTPDGIWVHCVCDGSFIDSWLCKFDDVVLVPKHQNNIRASMPGKITNILVKKADTLKVGDVVLVMEAMKMEYMIKSTVDSKIKSVNVKKNDQVKKDDILVEFEKQQD